MQLPFLQHVFLICLAILQWNVGHGLAQPKRSLYAIKDKHVIPRSWSNVGPAPASHVIQLQIGLKQGDFAELERHLFEVSDPSHRRYGQHLDAGAVNKLIKPSETTLKEVEDWLSGCGIKRNQLQYSPAKDWIKVSLQIESAESLLDTKYSVFKHEDGSILVRTPQWSLPQHLHEHIETVQPTNSFLRSMAKRSNLRFDMGDFATPPAKFGNNKATAAEVCNVTAVTTNCLRTLYGTANYTVQSASKNSIGVPNFLGETANRSDINVFLQSFRPDAVSASTMFKVQTVNGGVDKQSPANSTELAAGQGVEGNLDAETVLGISYPTPMTVYNTAGSPPFKPDAFTPTDSNEPFLDWVNFMLSNQTTLPNVISISYGDDEQTVPPSYAQAVCNGFAQMGARGVTVLVASGDDGVGPQGLCFKNDGTNSSSFLPEFPASCPYVTTVGGTKNVAPEIVATNADGSFASGGGFSNYFARPAYQNNVVPAYMTSMGQAFQGLYNTSGRSYPDIAAQAFQYLIVYNGKVAGVSGTSAATPTAASVIALVNDAMIAAGKPVMGFMNPWLYSVGSKAFTDVMSGSALGCNTTGFPATTGWDAVTGFGTPNFNAIRSMAMNRTAA